MASSTSQPEIELSLHDLLALIQRQAQIVAGTVQEVGVGSAPPEALGAATLRLSELVNHFTRRLADARETTSEAASVN